VSEYKKRLDEVIISRDTTRSPDKKGEEEKYKYLEKINSTSEKSKMSRTTEDFSPIKLFLVEEAKEESSLLPHSFEYYASKTEEIGKLVSEKKKVGLLSLTDLIEDVFDYNFSKQREARKILRVTNTIERLTWEINNIVDNGV
jgi:hypothetical protein